MTSQNIRKLFLDFFSSKGHMIVPSAPIVLKNDPTLMFTNAGMNQFKDYFLGNKKPIHPRVADTQKCLRVSGKHNDLEEVGVDTYHHTMFEMLGNWSFGDYFKKEAIEWSWELLTNVYKIPKDRLYVTVFQGDKKENLERDDESISEWKKWIDGDRIIMGNKKDNFWEMGDTGPCGPCTEIHVDCRSENDRKKADGASLVNMNDPQVIEIWNNVFIQYDRQKDGSLQSLPDKHVDTGMGLERLVRVLQNKNSNYDTDIFTGTIKEVEKITGKKYKQGSSGEDVSFRVIADHIRAIAFTIADGQLPSNTGAGYVVRRILRRAVRYYYSWLDHKEPLLYLVIPVIATQFKDVFPGLLEQSAFVSRVVKEEEESFLNTLGKGLKRIDDIIRESGELISGKQAFELYDTYGFPLDLTKLIAQERSVKIDESGFGKEMDQQKKRSRAATSVDTSDWIVIDENGRNEFVGYTSKFSTTNVVKYRKVKSKNKEAFQVVIGVTPFYAESGGQVGDKGWLEIGEKLVEVSDTRKENDLIVHFTSEVAEDMSQPVNARIDLVKRKNTEVHHTATHLLHAALRKVLGTHVQQKGSLVEWDHLRFDFSHFSKMSDEEISAVEGMVNEKIRLNIPVLIKEMKKEEALEMGAMALFGEKYGDMVRVVIIDPEYSVELCGGTHVISTGELGIFKVLQETAIQAGVRRIEAVCGAPAEKYLADELNSYKELKRILKNPADVIKAVESLQNENATLKKSLEKFESARLSGIKSTLIGKLEKVNGNSFIGQLVDVNDANALKQLCFDLRDEIADGLVILGSNIQGKPHVALYVSDSMVKAKNLDASKIIKEKIAPLIRGGGGGQKNLATAGGQDVNGLQEVIRQAKNWL